MTLSAAGERSGSPTGRSSHLSAGRSQRDSGPTVKGLLSLSAFRSQLRCLLGKTSRLGTQLAVLPPALPASLPLCPCCEHRPGRNGGGYLGACRSSGEEQSVHRMEGQRLGSLHSSCGNWHWLPSGVYLSSFCM